MSRVTEVLQDQWGTFVFEWIFGRAKFTDDELKEAREIYENCANQIRLAHDLHTYGEGALHMMSAEEIAEVLNSPFITAAEMQLIRNYRLGRASNKRESPAVSRLKRSGGFVYLAENRRNGLTKIGWSRNPNLREQTLQSEEPEVSFIFVAKASIQREHELHERYHHLRTRGEWFNLSAAEIAQIKEIFAQ